ncbi:MAG TPA: nucleotidyltransferase domain-containing protein [Desulfovibrio sp.]|uniref:nucleotidyltransferase domain-containing protein n=1 Tax=Desulfovibrio sp. TaxID=885 RepID=UPI002D6EA02F|nr:nucleotidyltransferase domain-containing protein [Desulfovibrio sp.]HZF61707.1 nucleotidyltransferase domain-containing protein [Desulfovibrio sp.]
MINAETWMADLLPRLQHAFGARLRYLGLQGSYRRGEVTEASDIDVVVLLDAVALDDLDVYRAIVRAMPEGQKACGFIGGAGDIFHWPRHELFAFQKDTEDWFGKLENFLPVITDKDAADSAKIGAAGLVHLLTHTYLYADAAARPLVLKDAYKAAFFVMLVRRYLASGVFCRSKKELLTSLEGSERDIIAVGLDLPLWLAAHTERQCYDMLLRWCKDILYGSNLGVSD